MPQFMMKHHQIKIITTFCIVLYSGIMWSQTDTCKNFPKPEGKDAKSYDICVETQGDSATPKKISVPIIKVNGDPVSIAIGPLSPVESCSLAGTAAAPSTTTDQASLARLIGTLLGSTIAAPTVPTGITLQVAQGNTDFKNIIPAETQEKTPDTTETPTSKLIKDVDSRMAKVGNEFLQWKERRQAATDTLATNQRLFIVSARRPESSKSQIDLVKQLALVDDCLAHSTDCKYTEADRSGLITELKLTTDAETAQLHLVNQLQSLTDCLNEEKAQCVTENDTIEPINANTKIDYEKELQEISPLLAELADLLKASPECSKITDSNDKEGCEQDKKKYPSHLDDLYKNQAAMAGLQSDDTKLRAAESALSTLYAQSYKVYQHAINANYIRTTDGLFEVLTITPGDESDLTANVNCTSVVDNTVTLGPVPISLHAGIPHFIFSAGGLFVIAPTQTIGEVQVADSSTAGFHTVVQQTGSNGFQMIPFAFGTVPLFPHDKLFSDSKVITGFGVTGGIGFNPYPGIQGIDFFSGFSLRFFQKIYLHGGIHSGRFVYTDPHAGFAIGATLPAGFPTSVPTITRFTHRAAFGASYSF
jgi:hypothetical protein